MLELLRRKLTTRNRLNERIIWGIWAPRGLQLAYKLAASQLRVPMSVLVPHILRQWLAENHEMLEDEQKRAEFGEYLARKYLGDGSKDAD